MKIFFNTMITILFSYKLFSGELIWESFGTDNMSSIYQYEEGKHLLFITTNINIPQI